MPKTRIAKNVSELTTLHFRAENGDVVGLTCDVEVNYGDRGMLEQVEIYPLLASTERNQIQAVYTRLKQIVKTAILD